MACIVFSSCNATGGNSGDISTGFLSILTGEASATHADTSVWVHAQSWKDAAQQELSGTATNTNTGQSYNWNADDTSGALEARDNPDIPGAGAIDHAIVMEDLFDQPNDDLDYNDNYFNVTVDRLSLNSVTATDAANTDNAVETFGLKAPSDLYVIEKDTGSTEVNLAATLLPADAAPEANWHALWELKRAGTVVESGTFDDTSVALPTTPTQGDFELVAGIDTNGDNVLQTDSIGNEVTHKITIHAVKIEVRINGTDDTNDDVVRQGYDGFGSDIPASYPSVLGEVRLARPLPIDMTVDLDNPDGHVGFTEATTGTEGSAIAATSAAPQSTIQPILPKTGLWQSYRLYGLSASASIGDASIRVMAHLPSYTGGVIVSATEKPMTVFWFTNALMKVKSNGNYNVVNGKYIVDDAAAAGATAVSLEAGATDQPVGLDGTIPQLKDLRVGIVQNVWSSTRVKYGISPHAPTPHLPGIFPVSAQDTISLTWQTAGPTLDSFSAYAAPLFDKPGGRAGETNDPNSLVQPGGLQRLADRNATSTDTPQIKTDNPIGEGMYNGNKVTRVEWTFKNVTIAESFRDWAVICEQAGDGSIIVIAPLKENGWTLNVDSSAADATTQRASPIAAFNPAMGIDPVDSPVLSGPLANQLGAPVKAYGPNEVSPVPGF